jgi:hypothetical protein
MLFARTTSTFSSSKVVFIVSRPVSEYVYRAGAVFYSNLAVPIYKLKAVQKQPRVIGKINTF